ncbi:MAG: hypothetical protein ABL998_13965, partial [Planctomycetota bacterium]
AGDLEATLVALERALERDPHSLAAWELRERWAAAKGDKDEEIHALHRQLSLARTQKLEKSLQDALKARLLPLDPAAAISSMRAPRICSRASRRSGSPSTTPRTRPGTRAPSSSARTTSPTPTRATRC